MYGRIMYGTVKYGNKTRNYPLVTEFLTYIHGKTRGLVQVKKYFGKIYTPRYSSKVTK